MEKNLAPIKCSIIEKKLKKNIVDNESLETEQEKATSCRDMLPINKTEEEEKAFTQEIEKVHEQYRKMYRNILEELKKKKLNEIEVMSVFKKQVL